MLKTKKFEQNNDLTFYYTYIIIYIYGITLLLLYIYGIWILWISLLLRVMEMPGTQTDGRPEYSLGADLVLPFDRGLLSYYNATSALGAVSERTAGFETLALASSGKETSGAFSAAWHYINRISVPSSTLIMVVAYTVISLFFLADDGWTVA